MVIVVLIIIGLCFGSMVNALVWRLHHEEQGKQKVKKQKSIIVKLKGLFNF